MAYTETTKTSYGSNIGNSFKGILGGLLLFIAAFPILFWNEGKAVKVADALKEGAASVVSVNADSIDFSNENKLVHVSGQAKTDAVLEDAQFGIKVNAMALQRSVAMYQWQENSSTTTEKKLGGSTEQVTTYTYAKGWSEHLIDSSSFKESGHDNPATMPYESGTVYAGNATVGAFTLTNGQIKRIGVSGAYTLPADTPMPAALAGKAKKETNGFYIGADPANPQIGDIRVTFQIGAPEQPISIVAKQAGSSFAAYLASNGESIDMLSKGNVPAENMFQSAQDANKMRTWIIRLVCFFMMFTGLKIVFAPLAALANVVPVLGSIISGATGIVAFLIALACFLIAVAIAWVVARPVLSIVLLAVAVAAVIVVFVFKKKKKAAAA